MELPLSTQYTQRKISASTTEFTAGEFPIVKKSFWKSKIQKYKSLNWNPQSGVLGLNPSQNIWTMLNTSLSTVWSEQQSPESVYWGGHIAPAAPPEMLRRGMCFISQQLNVLLNEEPTSAWIRTLKSSFQIQISALYCFQKAVFLAKISSQHLFTFQWLGDPL